MDFTSVCDHTSEIVNRATMFQEFDLFNHENDYRPNWKTRISVVN